MTRVVLWSSNAGDIPANLAFTNNFAATTNPGVGNDISQGYSAGSVWINQLTSEGFVCVANTKGAANWQTSTTGSGTPGQITAPAAATPTGAGSAALLTGGAGGTTSGSGGAAAVRGGAGTAGNSNGGSGILQGGAAQGSGVNGSAKILGVFLKSQGAPVAQDTAATLSAAQILAGIITSAPAAAINLQLPLATAMDTAIQDANSGDAFDFSLINTTSTPADTDTVTTNTGWTLVGSMVVAPLATGGVSARFRARKTAAGAWTLYRIS